MGRTYYKSKWIRKMQVVDCGKSYGDLSRSPLLDWYNHPLLAERQG